MKTKTFIVGIAGGTGSGKTTIAAGIAAALGAGRATLIDADSYYADLSHIPLQERHYENFDHPNALNLALLAQHLRNLKAGKPVTRHVYDFTTHTSLRETVILKPAPVIIVEGILIFVPQELSGLFNLKIYLDEDADIRLLRRMQRDMAERGRTMESVSRQYLEQVRPMHEQFVEPTKAHSDIVIGPGQDKIHVIERLTARIIKATDNGEFSEH
jgi:uridine kinase